MPNYILTNTSVILCPHGGMVTHIPLSISEFTIEGALPLLLTDQYLVVGCPGIVAGGTYPCINAIWVNPSMMLFVRGRPALTNVSTGMVRDAMGIVAGPALVTSFQVSYPEPTTVTNVN